MKFPRKLTTVLIFASLIVLTACGSGDGDSNSQPTDSPATEAPDTEALPTDAPPPEEPPTDAPPAPTQEPTDEKVTEKISFDFVTEFGTIEELDPLLEELLSYEGVLNATGSVFNVTITYDPDILTEDDLRQIMSDIGRPVKD